MRTLFPHAQLRPSLRLSNPSFGGQCREGRRPRSTAVSKFDGDGGFKAALPKFSNVELDAWPWYAVTAGRRVGLFNDWYGEVEPLIDGYGGARYMRFTCKDAAQRWLQQGSGPCPPGGLSGTGTAPAAAGQQPFDSQNQTQKAEGPFYAVARGRQTGIFSSWSTEVAPLIDGYTSSLHKKFPTREEAESWLASQNLPRARPVGVPHEHVSQLQAAQHSQEQASRPDVAVETWDEAANQASTSGRDCNDVSDTPPPASSSSSQQQVRRISSASRPQTPGTSTSAQQLHCPPSAHPQPASNGLLLTKRDRARQMAFTAFPRPPVPSSPALVRISNLGGARRLVAPGSSTKETTSPRSAEEEVPGPGRSSVKAHRLEFDGGSRGNPGYGGFGALLREDDRQAKLVHLVCGVSSQSVTNNQAEYMGLVHGMKAATGHRIQALKVQGDSQLIIRQVSGEYNVNSALLKPLYQQVVQMRKEHFPSLKAAHVMRHDNKLADSLANIAMDAGLMGRELRSVSGHLPEEQRSELLQWTKQRLMPSSQGAALPRVVERAIQAYQPELLDDIKRVQRGAAHAPGPAPKESKLAATVVLDDEPFSVEMHVDSSMLVGVSERLPSALTVPLFLHLLVKMLRQ